MLNLITNKAMPIFSERLVNKTAGINPIKIKFPSYTMSPTNFANQYL